MSSPMLSQDQISHRYHIEFYINGNPDIMRYSCVFDDGENNARCPKSAEAALSEFHRYMQRSKKLPHDAYKVSGVYDTYVDHCRIPIKRNYDIPKTSNPDLISKAKPQEIINSMFDDLEIVNESITAKVKTKALYYVP